MKQFFNYQIEEEIGNGGFGKVYLAKNMADKCLSVIKFGFSEESS